MQPLAALHGAPRTRMLRLLPTCAMFAEYVICRRYLCVRMVAVYTCYACTFHVLSSCHVIAVYDYYKRDLGV